ncbi:MAG: hypothetical protein QM820_06495 [Minicystis sp.]
MSAWFHRVAGPEFLFGYRSRPIAGGRWQEALRARCGLDLRGDQAHWLGELVGNYRLVELVELLSGRTDAERWSAPHPCTPLGSVRGLLGIRWRSSLPVKKRIKLAEHLCFALCGPVINTGTGEVFDPVQMKPFHLENLTDKWGFHDGDVFFDDPEYRAYVHRQISGVARGAGVDVIDISTTHNPFRTAGGKEARRARGASKIIEIWCFDRFGFNEPALGAFFTTNEATG